MSSILHPSTWSIKKMPSLKEYDFIVCGGGSAGAALASRLSEDPTVSVLLLEAGGNGLSLESRIPAAAGKLQHTEVDWEDYCEPQPNRACLGLRNGTSYWPRGKCLGGSSVINYMAYVRGHPEDFNSWSEITRDPRWSFDQCQPAFLRIEKVLGVTVRQPVHPLASDFLQAVKKCGHTVGNYLDKDEAGLHRQSVLNGARRSVADAYLYTNGVLKRSNLHVVCFAMVNRVVFDKDRKATGVEFAVQNQNFVVHSKKEIILSCSAIGTPCVLLRSGVGPAELLNALKIPIVVSNEHVGRHLEDHLAAQVLLRPKPGKQLFSVNTQRAEGTPLPLLEWMTRGTGYLASSAYDASLFFKSSPDAKWPQGGQVGLLASPGNKQLWETNIGIKTQDYVLDSFMADNGEGALLVPVLLHPESKGFVEITSANPSAKPRIVANYLLDPADLETMVDIVLKSIAISKEMDLTAEPVLPADLTHLPLESRELWREMVRRFASTLYHPTSSCKMGLVVDSSLQVLGVSGLRIADASIMPHNTSGNTNAPSIMVGERCADFLAEQYGLKMKHSNINKGKL